MRVNGIGYGIDYQNYGYSLQDPQIGIDAAQTIYGFEKVFNDAKKSPYDRANEVKKKEKGKKKTLNKSKNKNDHGKVNYYA